MRRSMGDRWGTDTDMESHSAKLMKHVNSCNHHAIFVYYLLFLKSCIYLTIVPRL